jgi:hypothetical protein
VGLRLYSDDGENQHLDGSGHWGWVFCDKDNGSGAIAAGSTKAKGVGESVPINELMASMHAVRSVLLLKHISRSYLGQREATLILWRRR